MPGRPSQAHQLNHGKIKEKAMSKLKSTDRVEPVMQTLVATQVQVFTMREPTGKTLALARVTLNDQLQLTGLRVVNGSAGLFVSYPNDPSYKGEDFRSLFYPITKDLREHIEQAVVAKYQEAVK